MTDETEVTTTETPDAPAAEATEADDAPKSALEAVEQGLAEVHAEEDAAKAPDAPTPEAAAKPDTQDAAKPDAPAEQDKIDPDTVLDGVKNPKQRERIQSFIEQHKETEAKLAELEPLAKQLNDERQQWYETIQSTGTTPQQLAETFGFLRLMNSPNPSDKRQALEQIGNVYKNLALALGEDAPGVDVAASDPALLARIEAGEIDRSTALEILKARKHAELLEAQQGHRAEQDAQRARDSEQQAAVDAGLAEVDALYERLSGTDPDFERKRAYLAQTVAPLLSQTAPPNEWAQRYQQAYDALGNLGPRGLPPGARPISGSRNGGGGTAVPAPKSAVEAVMQGLGITA